MARDAPAVLKLSFRTSHFKLAYLACPTPKTQYQVEMTSIRFFLSQKHPDVARCAVDKGDNGSQTILDRKLSFYAQVFTAVEQLLYWYCRTREPPVDEKKVWLNA